MEMPKPGPGHRVLESFAGDWQGEETMHPSHWDPAGGVAQATTTSRVICDGFYVAGDYEARKGSGIDRGSISWHPGGHAHGPLPAAIEASFGKDYFDEVAVMVDTFRPLEYGEAGPSCEDPAYAWSWVRD